MNTTTPEIILGSIFAVLRSRCDLGQGVWLDDLDQCVGLDAERNLIVCILADDLEAGPSRPLPETATYTGTSAGDAQEPMEALRAHLGERSGVTVLPAEWREGRVRKIETLEDDDFDDSDVADTEPSVEDLLSKIEAKRPALRRMATNARAATSGAQQRQILRAIANAFTWGDCAGMDPKDVWAISRWCLPDSAQQEPDYACGRCRYTLTVEQAEKLDCAGHPSAASRNCLHCGEPDHPAWAAYDRLCEGQ